MAGDFGLFLIDNVVDLKIENEDLAGDEGLDTAIIISLFTDKRVKEEELPELESDKKGYWGDMFPEVDKDQIGSRLWLLNREKRTVEVLRKAEDYARESLNWMIEDGVIDSINVTAAYNENKFLILDLSLPRPNGKDNKFQVNWDKQELRRV